MLLPGAMQMLWHGTQGVKALEKPRGCLDPPPPSPLRIQRGLAGPWQTPGLSGKLDNHAEAGPANNGRRVRSNPAIFWNSVTP